MDTTNTNSIIITIIALIFNWAMWPNDPKLSHSRERDSRNDGGVQ
jgi:hypothetical protein